MKLLFSLFALTICLLVGGCSVVDGGDRAELEKRVAALPPDANKGLRDWAVRELVLDHLKKTPNTKIGAVECRYHNGIQWLDWVQTDELNTDLFIQLMTKFKNYSLGELVDLVLVHVSDKVVKDFDTIGVNYDSVECRAVFNPAFELDRIAADVRGSDKQNPGDFNRLAELLTISQIVDLIIGSNVAPPLPAGVLAELLPALCALGTTWGCPGGDGYPGGGDASSGGDWQ